MRVTVQDGVRHALAAIAAGEAVVVVDDDRDDGELVFAAEHATTELMAFTVRHTSGFVCVALQSEDCDRLRLPPMYHRGGDRYRVAVDLRGNGTGISANARARTAAALANPDSVPTDFVRPGHIVPLEARPGGVLQRAAYTEAAMDLARLAGSRPAGVLCTIMSEQHPGETARREELLIFARQHGLSVISVAELIAYRRRTEPQVIRTAAATLPTEQGDVCVLAFKSVHDGSRHLAILAGPVRPDVPLYVHIECLSGTVVQSTLCKCGRILDERLAEFTAARSGVVIYARVPEQPQACGLFEEIDLAARAKVHEIVGAVLSELGATSLRVLDGESDLVHVLYSYGIRVAG